MAVQEMLNDIGEVFAIAELEVNAERCSFLFKEGRNPNISSPHGRPPLFSWSGHKAGGGAFLLGDCIRLKQDSCSAVIHRQAVGNACFHKWWPVLGPPKLHLIRRVRILFAAPFLAATLHSEPRTLTKKIASELISWVRLKLGQVVGIHRSNPKDDVSSWWKNIHRARKVVLYECEKNPVG